MTKRTKRFRTIVVDPPWPENKMPRQSALRFHDAQRHFPLLTLEDIKALPIPRVAARDCRILLWATQRSLGKAITEVLPAWGFRYVGTRVWLKSRHSLGFYLLNDVEFAVLGVRTGDRPRWRGMFAAFSAPRTGFAEKPECAFVQMARWWHAPRLELFARRVRPGWSVWGNEVGDPFGWTFDPENWRTYGDSK